MKKIAVVTLVSLVLAATACGERPKPAGAVVSPSESKSAGDSESEVEPLKVVNFNQKSTTAGTAFNVQRDGNSGITFELNRPLPAADVKAWFNGQPLPGVVANEKLVTATIPTEYLRTPGEYPVELEVSSEPERLPAGMFTVKAP